MIIMGVMVGERGSEGIDNDPEQHFAVMPRMRGWGSVEGQFEMVT